jgi:hypothetical protein
MFSYQDTDRTCGLIRRIQIRRLYVRLHNFLVYLFIQRFSQHVSVVYDHHQAVFT